MSEAIAERNQAKTESSNQNGATSAKDRDTIGMVSGGLFVLSLVVFGGCWREGGHDWVVALFAAPLLVQCIGLIVLYLKPRTKTISSFYTVYLCTMFLCIVFHYLLWLLFLNEHSNQLLSLLALFFIGLLLLVVVAVTLALMLPTSPSIETGRLGSGLRSLRLGVLEMPFWALLHFFAVFLTVSYLFGFALAFHDRGIKSVTDKKPIIAGEDQSRSQEEEAVAPPLYKSKLAIPHVPKSLEPRPKDDPQCFHFFFATGSARFEKDDPNATSKPRIVSRLPANQRSDNWWSLTNLVAVIQRRAFDIKTGYARPLRVTLVGRASEPRFDRGAYYKSNYELSEARIQSVRYEAINGLTVPASGIWLSTEWVLVPLSSEQSWLSTADQTQCWDLGRNHQVVEAYVEPVPEDVGSIQMAIFQSRQYERLDLMDYMYFSIYTITTTGYGDIVPTTRYAKLVCSLANICEVFFIVGFFNALIALKGDKDPQQSVRNTLNSISALLEELKGDKGPQQPVRGYRILYSPEVVDHLRALTRRQRTGVMYHVETYLIVRPKDSTESKTEIKLKTESPTRELRVGKMRVYYDADGDENGVVSILAVGIIRKSKRSRACQIADKPIPLQTSQTASTVADEVALDTVLLSQDPIFEDIIKQSRGWTSEDLISADDMRLRFGISR